MVVDACVVLVDVLVVVVVLVVLVVGGTPASSRRRRGRSASFVHSREAYAALSGVSFRIASVQRSGTARGRADVTSTTLEVCPLAHGTTPTHRSKSGT